MKYGLWSIILVAMLCAFASLAEAREISGTVLLPNGEPAEDARVRLFYVHCPTGYGMEELLVSLSNADGSFSINVPGYQPPAIIPFPMTFTNQPGLYLVAEKEDYAAVIQSVAPRRSSGYELELTDPVSVRIVAGAPEVGRIEGAYIWVSSISPLHEGAQRMPATDELPLNELIWNAKTGEGGLAELKLPPNVIAQVSAIMENGNAGQVMVRTSDEGRVAANILLRNRVIRFEGRVTHEDETTPIAGQVVTMGFPRVRGMATTTPRGHSVAISDEDGRFELSVIVPRGMEQFLERLQAVLIARDPSHDPEYADSFTKMPDGWLDQDEFSITMRQGVQITGRVINDLDDTPLPHTVIQITPSAPELRAVASLYRLADAEGAFRARLDVDGALWRVQFPPAGHVNVGGNYTTVSTVLNRPAEVELRFPAASEAPGFVKVAYPDGNPAEGARVIAWQREVNQAILTRTDAEGRAWVDGLAAGRPALIHVIGDGVFGAHVSLMEIPAEANQPVDITLRDGRIGIIRLVDDNEDPVGEGVARIMLMGAEDREIIAPIHTLQFDEEGVARIEGLQPNTRYGVALSPPRDLRPADNQRGLIIWQFDENEPEPTLTFRLQRPQERQQPAAVARGPRQPAGPPPRTEEDFRNELNQLERTAQSYEDSINESITWLADEDGRFIAYADADSMEIRRFDRLFGMDRLVVTGITFTEQRVWVATERGLIAWDRRHQYWGRFAVDGIHIETYVRELELRDGFLDVTTGREGEEPRRFEFNMEAGRWRGM